MNFDKESKSDFFFFVWGGGERGRDEGDSNRKKENIKNNRYSLIFCAHALHKISSSWLKWFSCFNINKRSN